MKKGIIIALAAASACSDTEPPEQVALPPDLEPVRSTLAPGEPYYAPQPHRDHPYAVALSADGEKAYVALRGSEAEPGDSVAVVRTSSLEVIGRIKVGSSPNGLTLHPGGRFLVVTNRFSAFLSVIDTRSDRQVQKIPLPYYAIEVAFDTAGVRAWVTNRWLDAVQVFDVAERDDGLSFTLRDVPQARLGDRLRGMSGIPVGCNPRDVVVDEASGRVFVANMPDLTITVIEMASDRSVATIPVSAPVNDLAVLGGTLFVATLGRGTGHPADEGPDTDGDGLPGDGTPNVHFHDLQNEIATYDTRTLRPGPRYTSDSYTGFFGDAPEDAPGVPPARLRIVRGSLPEQLVVLGDRLVVTMAASAEVSVYRVEGDQLRAEAAWPVGLFPYGLAGRGDRVFVANRMSETLTRLDLSSGRAERVIVGDVSGGEFPATDMEIGEAIMNSTALWAADGDASCEHCHRESSAIRRVASAPHAKSRFAMRNTPTMRYLLRSRPLMFENFLDETNFSPMKNEFARVEDFGPGAARSDYPDRRSFYLDVSETYAGRRTSFGDSIEARPLDFEGMAAMMGLALIMEPRLLPNPNPKESFSVERGKALFESANTACAACHPAPDFNLSRDGARDLPLAMTMLTPATFEGEDIDELADGVKQRFGIESHQFGAPTLIGIWDRPEIFHHDGRARSLVESIATPDHPALEPGQRGVNERDGVLDIHGGTSHLTAGELRDLIEYMLSL